ncbi:MAG: hypothetical protein UZ22_OP11002000354 [Microgenomates bacterium OLB23]|nr:MAG: hypothetical protein UZ22_OP11002000354 [Microgenomates bacterium OLB23]
MRKYLPLIGIAFILSSFALLNSTVLFTYRSSANQDIDNTMKRVQQSVESVDIINDLPTCVAAFSYIPIAEKSLQSCFVQFTCNGQSVANFFEPPHYTCTADASKNTCSENELPAKCAYIDEWLEGAAYVCGCSL